MMIGKRNLTHVESDDDARGVILGQLNGGAEESVVIKVRRDESRSCRLITHIASLAFLINSDRHTQKAINLSIEEG